MSKCENCIHYDVCNSYVATNTNFPNVDVCDHYKDKSLCVDLPCEMDATIYFIDSKCEKQGRKKVKVEFVNSGAIDNVTIGELGIPQIEICTKDNVWITFDAKEDFGVNCFTDPADAENKLKEVRG